MTKREAYIVARMFYRLGEQIEKASIYGRSADAYAMSRIVGRLEYLIFEGECCYRVEYATGEEMIADLTKKEAA